MKKILFLLAVAFFAFQLNSFAAINVSNVTGIIKIIPAGGGTPITVNPGQPIPPIPDGSTIDVITGNITVATTPPSTVYLSIEGNTIKLPPGTTIQISINTNGAIKVTDSVGSVFVRSLGGKTTTLNPGDTIIIAGNTITFAEGYQPPVNPGQQVNNQVKIDEGSPDFSPNGR